MLALIVELKKKYKTGLLTNFVHEWIIEIINHYDLTNYFDKFVISAKEKIIKPDSKIYHLILQQLNVASKEAVFIDDRKLNITGANKVGMKGILYRNYIKLINELELLGIIE